MFDITEPPDARRSSTWSQMTKRERAFAAWLLLRTGWQNIDLPAAASYDMERDTALVEFEPGGTIWYAAVRWEAEETLANIEARFGVEARKRAEEICGQDGGG